MFSNKHDRQDEEHKKRVLWISVAVIGVTIFFFWLFNFSSNVKSSLRKEKLPDNKSADAIVPEIKEQLKEINKELDKIKAAKAQGSAQE